MLVDLLGKSEVEAELRRRAKKVTEPVDADDESLDEPRETDTAAMRGSVYRGVSPSAAAGALVCGVCRRPLEPDDPEIVLGEAGRVCVLCSQRERR